MGYTISSLKFALDIKNAGRIYSVFDRNLLPQLFSHFESRKIMNYISEKRSSTLSNEPYELSYDDIRQMYLQNQKEMEECRQVTESSYRGESYYAGDGRPGDGKVSDFRAAFFKEVLYRDMKTAGFMMQYPHGLVIGQGQTNHFYRGENQIFAKSQPTLYRSLEKLHTQEEKELYSFG